MRTNKGHYYIPTVADLVAMQDPKDEPLTSFAENPTKSVEKDALVESQLQFTRPDQVEKANVEEAKWPWTKGKHNEKWNAPFLFVLIFIALLAIVLFAVLFGTIRHLNSTTPTARTQPEPITYTLPTVDYKEENRKAVLASVIFPEVLEKEEEPSTEAPTQEITENLVEEVEVKEKDESDSVEFHATNEPAQDETTTSFKTLTSTSLQFHDSPDGIENENCFERHLLGSPSGIYRTNSELGFRAFCDMETTTGGWTVIQRRIDGEGSFHRGTMKDYEEGFGDLQGSHWLGLNQLYHLAPTGSPPAILRIEIQGETCDLTCSKRFANTWVGEWKVNIGPKEDGYKLIVTGKGVGNLTFDGLDPFASGNGKRFTTVDGDLDENLFMNCAQFRMVGKPWWHPKACSDVGLNGYHQTTAEKYDVHDRNQNAKRYFVWAFEKETFNGFPYIIHVRKSKMLLKPDIESFGL
uniref:Fibrinogen C-terminal domain-containing protein n=1 Tax=Caenorhabditis tropicalis TaxID=1561998 RepID=A0A1I7URR6_9PELO